MSSTEWEGRVVINSVCFHTHLLLVRAEANAHCSRINSSKFGGVKDLITIS